MSTKITVTLTMFLEHETGRDLTPEEADVVRFDTEHAIQNRLFGEGFLPDDILVETWDVKHG